MADEFDRIITSPKLAGIKQDCRECRWDTDMRSTGKMFHDPDFGGLDDVQSWFLEYYCPGHEDSLTRWDANTHDIVREVLRENGITVPR